MAGPALAVVDVQLNLRYTDPNNPTGGGSWDLLVQVDAEPKASPAFKPRSAGALGVTGVDTPLAAITPNAAVFTAGNERLQVPDGRRQDRNRRWRRLGWLADPERRQGCRYTR